MRIGSSGYLNTLTKKETPEESKLKTSKENKIGPVAIYEKSKTDDKTHVYDKVSIDKLKQESEKVYASLKQMVEELLTKQGKSFDLSKPNHSIKIDEATRSRAKESIAEDGELGIESMSETIVDFAKVISGGDSSKLDKLRGAIEKGFKAAEKVLGKLPEISLKTYDRIIEKLDKWEKE